MLDTKFIRQNPEKVKEGCKNKQVSVDIDQFLELDKKRREALKELESLRAEQNRQSYLISRAVDPTIRDEKISRVSEIKADIRRYENYLKKIEPEYQKLLRQIPNLPLEDVPIGKSEKENIVLKEWGRQPKFKFRPKDYLEIAEKLDLIDIKRAAKTSGTRFGYLKGEAVLLEFALINLAFEVLTKEKFIPVIPPVMIKPEMMHGMGYIKLKMKNEKLKMWEGEEMYFLRDDDLVLVGTSEQSIGPMHSDEIFDEKDLPKRYVGFSTCFRREAGAYGKDTKGILRVHQFDKVEMFSFCHPEESIKEHQFFLEMEEKLMQLLKIPYRVVQMCTGDLGDPAAAKYDIEAWLPGQNQYRETHSTSNCTDYQARRLNIRYKPRTSNLEPRTSFVHTINGTAFAIGRTLIAIIENYQQKDGSIKIPEVLRKYIIK